MRKRVLFLCAGNAVRSQMAEGWALHLHSAWLDAYSAGISPEGLDQMAVEVMREAGVDISAQRSKHVSVYADESFDLVVTVCDAARELCPVFFGSRIIHAGFADPSNVAGNEAQRRAAYRERRDEIKAFVETLPSLMQS